MPAKTKPDLKSMLADKVNSLSISTPEDTSTNTTETMEGSIIPSETEVMPLPDIVITIDEAKTRITMLQNFISEMMVEGQDYGVIPNVNKPSLFKPGAEKLCDIFGFAKHVEVTNRLENFIEGAFFYEVKVSLVNKRTGLLEAEGVGCCNSKENKYKSQSGFNVQNTILKMAKKRAFIDAVLSATRTSCIFTQDVEDTTPTNNGKNDKPDNKSSVKSNKKSTTQTSDQNAVTDKSDKNVPTSPAVTLTKAKAKQISNIIEIKKLGVETVKNIMQTRYGISESKYLTDVQACDFINHLLSYKTAQ